MPLLPFGLKEFDEGERFDLRSPYADEGWVSAIRVYGGNLSLAITCNATQLILCRVRHENNILTMLAFIHR